MKVKKGEKVIRMRNVRRDGKVKVSMKEKKKKKKERR